MLWGRARAAVRQLHPLHRSLVQDHKLAATLTPAGWQQLIAALGTHHTVLPQRKYGLPDRVWTTFVPLLRVLSQDVDPAGTIEVVLDLRGPDAPGKSGPLVQVRPGVGEKHQVDPWLRIRAKLRDGSRLHLVLTTRIRLRTITRRNPRGKVKRKQRQRALQVVTATRTVPAGCPLTRPAVPPPAWIRVGIRTEPKVVLRVAAKGPQPSVRDEVQVVLAVMSELFRWTPVAPAAPTRRRA
jgi:hypothetical protein